MGSLANARHDFRAGLRYGERARAAAPGVVKPYGVIVDAQVELGRYDAAERTLQRMVDLKPNLDSYARVSYFRELHGDLPGAIEAMRLAASAGGDARENLAYVQTLLGNLELARGRIGAARSARTAWRSSRYPGYVPAQAGLARVERARAATWPPRSAATARVVARLPLPEYVVGARRSGAGGRPPRRRARGPRARAGAAAPAAPRRRERRRRDGGRRGRPRQPGARGRARAARPGPTRPACAAPTRSAGR